MGDKFIVYNNKLWKEHVGFEYTGTHEEFTLQPATYLFVVNGGCGGKSHGESPNIPYGGSTYGILDLDHEQTFYAVVGGNGEDGNLQNTRTAGGYNGGGEGGKAGGTRWSTGAGGGGGSDVRLSDQDIGDVSVTNVIPDGIDEVEYVESYYNQHIDLNVIPTSNTKIECVCEVIENSINTNETLFGTRTSSSSNNLAFYSRFNGNNVPCYACSNTEQTGTGLTYNQKIKIVIDGSIAYWYDMNDQMLGSITNPKQQSNCDKPMFLFGLNNNGSVANYSYMKMYSFKMYDNNNLVRYMIPFSTGTQVDISDNIWDQGTISPPDQYDSTRIRTRSFIPVDQSKPYLVVVARTLSHKPLNVAFMCYDSSESFIYDDGWRSNGAKRKMPTNAAYVRLILKYTDNTQILPSDLVSCELISYENDSKASGMYDLCNNEPYYFTDGYEFGIGDVVQNKTTYTSMKSIPIGYLSRIIVAGGGGGASIMTLANPYQEFFQDYLGFGGGAKSSWVVCLNANATHNAYISADQSSGNAFGYGGDAQDRSTYSEIYTGQGQSGGGGGWYGGYAVKNRNGNVPYSSTNGSGGSSYVLTETSYKPTYYMATFEDIMPSLYFRDYTMLPNQAFDGPSISIYKEDLNGPKAGDTILIPYTGERQQFSLLPGTYRIKCYGGDGGVRYWSNRASKGGYAEGILHMKNNDPLFAYVGSSAYLSGINCSSADKDVIFNNKMSFNVDIGSYNNMNDGATTGGGSTDIRLIDMTEGHEDESLLSRIIVAGGGGGQGTTASYGGDGGGPTGGTISGTGYGTNNGPGTQSETPTQSSANGGFGYNGVGVNSGNDHPGSGGNGWFGGNGCIPDPGSDNDKSGSGGSGYILTETSYKPTGYIPTEDYWFTDPILTTGGNSIRGMTRIEIETLSIDGGYVIALDDESYKAYNTTTDEWESINIESVTPETMNIYGVSLSDVKSDAGLTNQYRFFIYDKYDFGIDSLVINVLPLTQHVLFYENMISEIIGETMDFDKDDNTDISMVYNITGIAENRKVNIDISISMNDIPVKNNIIYVVQFQTRNIPSSYYYPTKPEKTIQDLDLLYVGNTESVPYRYKPYIGSFMPDGVTAITDVKSSSACEYKRNIYIATLINGSVLRFVRFNIIENKAYIIRDNVPLTLLDPSGTRYAAGGSLLVDDKNMYLFASNYKNYTYPIRLIRIPFDLNKSVEAFTTPSWDEKYTGNGWGKAVWLDNTHIVTMSTRLFIIFDTTTATFTTKSDTANLGDRNELVMGKYTAISYQYSNSCTGPMIYNTEMDRITTSISDALDPGIKCACYFDGIFYVTQKGHLYTFEDNVDHNMIIKDDILTPYTSLQPKTISCSDGIIYVTCTNSSTLYMYNISHSQWYSASLPFSIGDFGDAYNFRPACYKGFFFIGSLKLYVTNFNTISKYRIGQKNTFDMIQTNNHFQNPYEYDERFITIDESGINAHTGNITKQFTLIDEENNILESEIITKDVDYRNVIEYDYTVREEVNNG